MPPDHWSRHAEQWAQLGPPLRPSPEDIALMRRRVLDRGCVGRSILLGVTPEIASMEWPTGTDLLAVDRCMGMVTGVWPPVDAAGRNVVRGDRFHLPVSRGRAASSLSATAASRSWVIPVATPGCLRRSGGRCTPTGSS